MHTRGQDLAGGRVEEVNKSSGLRVKDLIFPWTRGNQGACGRGSKTKEISNPDF